MRLFLASTILAGAALVPQAQQPGAQPAQNPASPAADQQPGLRVTSRNVVIDVIVTNNGKPVTGLSKDTFMVTESGKPQSVSFFEENAPAPQPQSVQIPKMPPDVFTNFSPFPTPPAVNVLLLDSLNTLTEDQSWVHKAALQFLKSAKPGNRMAIFTMGLGLHFIQGFSDDPSVLAAALSNKKNNEVENVGAITSQDEIVSQQNLIGLMSANTPFSTAANPDMIAALQNFMNENNFSRDVDRNYLTLENLQRLATFLQGFPGRKNIIWFSEKAPGIFVINSGVIGGIQTGNPSLSVTASRTLAMLAAARAALYPVDARGTSVNAVYKAENVISSANNSPQQMLGASNPTPGSTAATSQSAGSAAMLQQISQEDQDRNTDQLNAQLIADQSGGRAFANSNGLAEIIDKITSSSDNFYTIAYTPTNPNMDGDYRKIEIKVSGAKYQLSYRRGYFAVDDALPGSSLVVRSKEIQQLNQKAPGAVDPLLPFMDLGMPQSQQLLYKLRVFPAPAGTVAAAPSPAPSTPPNPQQDKSPGKDKTAYKIDFAVDASDLTLTPAPDGTRKGKVNISLAVYDRYANVVTHEEHLVDLNFPPDAWAAIQNSGVQLHAQLFVPAKGHYWLRTGILDRSSHKVGTMEIPLSAVVPLQQASK
ncbi:VWA domain-containing protein [Terracidiphilus gabretensis]|uniref:VWA domain-containing protein n=1 Tax=Terracidiphilus gabretensis TaxID=1577687 RepID=UPI00071C0D06|nr:VWA domain-containing protein [Terracidiphilus gabretensis]